MSKIYKIIVLICFTVAVSCMFWNMFDAQSLQQAQDEIKELERHREILIEVLCEYQRRDSNE